MFTVAFSTNLRYHIFVKTYNYNIKLLTGRVIYLTYPYYSTLGFEFEDSVIVPQSQKFSYFKVSKSTDSTRPANGKRN